MIKKVALSLMILGVMTLSLVGCNDTKGRSTETKLKTENNIVETDPEANDKYDGKEACATRTHFKEEVEKITYYDGKDKHLIEADSDDGKKIISLMKIRIATCEAIDEDTLSSDDIKGKYVSVEFKKDVTNTFYSIKEEKYKDVTFEGLMMPLEGENNQRMLTIPSKNGTFTVSGKPEQLSTYLDNMFNK